MNQYVGLNDFLSCALKPQDARAILGEMVLCGPAAAHADAGVASAQAFGGLGGAGYVNAMEWAGSRSTSGGRTLRARADVSTETVDQGKAPLKLNVRTNNLQPGSKTSIGNRHYQHTNVLSS
jgi:hypothetical protein